MVPHPAERIDRVFVIGDDGDGLASIGDLLRTRMEVVSLSAARDPKGTEALLQNQIATGEVPSLVLIALPVERAISAARTTRRQLPNAELVFLLSPADLEPFRRKAFHTPLGSYRILTERDPSSILRSVNERLRSFKQRRSFHTTIDRINVHLASASAAEPGQVRRLLISDRYRASLISNAVDAIISVDRERRITAWNRSANQLFRASISEGDLFADLSLGTCGPALLECIEAVFSQKNVPRQEMACQLPDGSQLQMEATFAPVLDDDLKVIGVSIIGRDISEAKRGERLLRLEHQITRELVEPGNLYNAIAFILKSTASEAGACVAEFWSVDESSNTIVAQVLWSEPNADLTAFTEQSRALRLRSGEGLPGRVWANPSNVAFCDPTNDVNFPRRAAARIAGLQSGLAVPISTGGHFFGAINLFSKTALKTDALLFAMMNAIATDLAQWIQRRRAETALEASERELRALADSIPQLAWMANEDGHIFWYNQRWFEYTGSTFEQMEGWGWQSVHDPAILPQVIEQWRASIDSGRPFEMEFPLRAADGSFRWFLTRVNPVRGDDNRILRWFGTNTDVDEVRRAREALRDAQAELQKHASNLEAEVARRTAELRETIQELEAFSYSVSHDMRSPLRAMQGYADALLTDCAPQLDDVAAGYLNRIHRAAGRMDLLIQDVLAYSRVAKGEILLKKTNLEAIVQDVIQHYPALQPDNACVTIDGPLPVVFAHEAYLTQIVSNLLGNAVKFITPGTFPRVTISATVSGEMVRFAFRDNGIGIGPDQQKQIFQIFGRVYPEKKFAGTGIGLAIVKKAAERMGGSVGVVSQLGSGSEFFVYLKRAE